MLEMTATTIDDFSGGKTDYPLAASPTQAVEMDNFVVNVNKKLDHAPGSRIFDDSFYQIPAGFQKVNKVFGTEDGTLFVQSARRVWCATTSAPTAVEIVGPTGNPALGDGTVSNFTSKAEWNGHVYMTSDSFCKPVKFYKDGSDVWQVRTAGMPALATTPTITSSGGSGNNYLYAFIYYYSYNVQTLNFEDFGPTTQVSKTNFGPPNTNSVTITGIPVISNGATDNYDTSNIKVKIYRTIAGGTQFFFVGEVTNGTTVFVDTVADATLTANNVALYVNGGAVDNDPPPLAKYVHVMGSKAYYAHVKDGTEIIPTRVFESIADDPDSAPADAFTDVTDSIMGVSSFGDNPIVFGKRKTYRLIPGFNELGQGSLNYEEISPTVGCVSNDSIVQTRDGVFWAGQDGFYWTDAFRVQKISDSLNETYKGLVSTTLRSSKIVGTYDSKDNRINWAVCNESIAQENDTLFVLHLREGIKPQSCFTTRQNGADFAPTALGFYNKQLIRGDTRGYIFKHDVAYTTDPLVDVTLPATSWATKAIVPTYISICLDGNSSVRKWVTSMLLVMENATNASIQLKSINDNSGVAFNLKEIRVRDGILWGDPIPVWGDDDILWNAFKLIQIKSRMPATQLRCYLKQIEITASFTQIYESNDFTTATVSNSSDTAVSNDSTTYPWPEEVVGYYIAFDSDSYVNEYKILARTDSTLTLQDLNGTLPTTGTAKWVIRGYRKSEVFNIVSYSVYFSLLTNQSFKTYRSEQDPAGDNA